MAALSVFNHQMACLHPDVGSSGGGLLCPGLPQSRVHSSSDSHSSPHRRPALLDLHKLQRAQRERGRDRRR